VKDKFAVLSIFIYVLFLVLINNLTVSYEGVESAGRNMPFDGEENPNYGKAYVLESDDYVDKALALTEAYSNLDKDTFVSLIHERLLPFADQMDDQETYSWKPWAMVPLRMVDDNGAFVVSWSYDESVQTNGSKAATHYIDVLRFNDEDNGKLSGIWSTFRPDPENSEYGLREGGKFFGRGESEYTGRPLVFSNRGEVETLEKLFEDYNNMDGEAVASYFADEWTFRAAEGGTSERTSEGMKSLFDNLSAVEWTPFSMAPLKIKDTDPQSGVTVYSREKRVNNDGEVWEKELVELFYFDLDGKISGVEQFQRDIE